MTIVTVTVSWVVYTWSMRQIPILLMLLAAVPAASVDAQRRFRIGPHMASVAVENGFGDSRSYTGYGGMIAVLSGDDNETGLSVSRYGDLSDNVCVRRMTLFGLNSLYYPVGAKGIAPFASTEIGLARVSESSVPLIFTCTASTPVETTSEIGFAFGLGLRVSAGSNVVGAVEGRFLQVPNSFVQGLEARANVSMAFGSPRRSEILDGTLGPVVSAWAVLSGPLRARAPLLGVRFRRNTNKSGVLGLQIDYAPLRVSEACTNPGCGPVAILFAPGYEPSVYAGWGRFYGEIGALLAGFPNEGPDRGMAQGLHGGIGADIFSGRVMWNANSRLLWLQRNSGQNVFAIQLGVGLSPRLERSRPVAGGGPP